MNTTLILLTALVAFLSIGIFMNKIRVKRASVAYVCDDCGASHCDCRRKSDRHNIS